MAAPPPTFLTEREMFSRMRSFTSAGSMAPAPAALRLLARPAEPEGRAALRALSPPRRPPPAGSVLPAAPARPRPGPPAAGWRPPPLLLSEPWPRRGPSRRAGPAGKEGAQRGRAALVTAPSSASS